MTLKIHPVTASGLRGCDPNWGCGNFGARRDGGKRSHDGVDYKAAAGEQVYSPITGTILRVAIPYVNDNRYTGLFISGTGEHQGVTAKIFYLTPDRISGAVGAGDKIGIAQDLRLKYPGITNHVHLELRVNGKLVNATLHH